MKLYFNDSQNAIDISSFNHIIQFQGLKTESYDITLKDQADINAIDNEYGDSLITSIVIKNDDNIKVRLNKNSLNLKFSSLTGRIDELGDYVSLQLVNA